MAKKKYRYEVQVTRHIESTGVFVVESAKKLTEDEVTEKAIELANTGDDPDDGWEETDTRYDEPEIVDGSEDLKEE